MQVDSIIFISYNLTPKVITTCSCKVLCIEINDDPKADGDIIVRLTGDHTIIRDKKSKKWTHPGFGPILNLEEDE